MVIKKQHITIVLKIAIVTIVFLSSFSLKSQTVSNFWDTSDGLSNNWISEITQDEKVTYGWPHRMV